MKSLTLDFVSVTEAAALASCFWVGRGRKSDADEAATTAMRNQLNQIDIDGTIVIGEGEMDEAPMLRIGEKVGTGKGMEVDIAVDPLEGTNLIVNGQSGSIAVIAAAPKGTLLHAPDMYMMKMAVGPQAAGKIDIRAPLIDNLRIVADASGKKLSELTVVIQRRDRHLGMIQTVREVGGRVQLFDDGDVTYAIVPALDASKADMFVGIGGAPEGVVSAVALKCLGGEMQAKLLPAGEEDYKRCAEMGLTDPHAALPMDRLVGSDHCIFSATGITDGMLLKGVRNRSGALATHTLFLNGTDRKAHFLETLHDPERVRP
ncbi:MULTISPECIES: class II fructose-bisphosphatase [Cohnella]|jgi:fructose-1,6-bisphosphatase II|uniref:class II fructose-bisphosphatase n=1 Tax=Cohnella TaxID=329857 RepID=UPI000372FA1A|nr:MULTISPECIES: class II fructose-bisphosphatase [Cohnella]REK65336.1 MAG: class II fructose-bisphosphatase [Cohnella sp.]